MRPSKLIKQNKPPTMFERVGENTPDIKKIKHNLKTIRDIRTSNTITKNRGMIRDDVEIDVGSIYRIINEAYNIRSFPNSLARLYK